MVSSDVLEPASSLSEQPTICGCNPGLLQGKIILRCGMGLPKNSIL